MNYTRENLLNRHRLSHQQINDLLGEQQNQFLFEEKLRQLNLLAAFLEITDYFQKENIWFLPLKGPLLSYRIYGDATCRYYRDFDFLVKPEAVASVIQVFHDWGYLYKQNRWPENESKRLKIISGVNQLTLYNPQKHQTVEIHWRVFIDPVIDYKKIQQIVNQNIISTEFAGRQMNQFTIEFELFYLIIHGGLHTWRRLKWLVDIHEIINRFTIDKRKFDELVKLFNAQRMIGLCNEMLKQFFPNSELLPVNYDVPTWFTRYCLKQINNNNNEAHPPYFSLMHKWFYLNAFPNIHYKRKRFFLMLSSFKKLNQALHSI